MSVVDLTDSRAATDALLGILKQGRWRPRALAGFLRLAARRSLRQAARRPRALGEATLLHGLLLAVARDRDGRAWVATSWTLTVLHLGLLEQRDRLSPADALTLLRGNLPATAIGSCRWSGLLALTSDLADGRLARRRATVSPFGDYAGSLADAAFWTWLVLRHEPSCTGQAAAIASWAAPVVTVTAVAVRRGTMPERPRPALLRPAAAMQAVLALRHILRR
ncbi:CDP-alcohol phosphatidyltransferase family protein [Streptomyces chiangmaiensis]|uniref:CDP-alcohol phosphatidyltransferase family protein n=1 Tax=Streptomyces chiangmaiensis TaxID=766497 RepID=A0ABU7F964_9ACTN|nr:CDP-alcohol phosphatidyltransferase family protein [Streptomyces chiangmaiensis]MED7820737.1 CDP-alcohol phosphatidyltransferase family protein [Streptomyces chiangmaiensis]